MGCSPYFTAAVTIAADQRVSYRTSGEPRLGACDQMDDFHRACCYGKAVLFVHHVLSSHRPQTGSVHVAVTH